MLSDRFCRNLETPNSGDGFFDWVIPTLTYPDDKIIQNHGIDTAMYIRYIRTFVFAFLGFFVLAYLIIVPINATGSNRNQPRNLCVVRSLVVIFLLGGQHDVHQRHHGRAHPMG